MPTPAGDPSDDRLRRRLYLLAATAAGIAFGVAGDFAAGDETISATELATALLLSPVPVTVAGASVTIKWLQPFFLVGGFLFLPIYFLCARHWMKSGKMWLLGALCVWTAQGYFQLVHRFFALMSV